MFDFVGFVFPVGCGVCWLLLLWLDLLSWWLVRGSLWSGCLVCRCLRLVTVWWFMSDFGFGLFSWVVTLLFKDVLFWLLLCLIGCLV